MAHQRALDTAEALQSDIERLSQKRRAAHRIYAPGPLMDPLPRRRVTFRNPKVETSPKRDVKDYSTEPSVLDVETWLEWQAKQLGTPTWWTELKAIPGIQDPWKLAQKIRASFYIPKVRMRTLLEPEYTVPPVLRSLDRNAFLPDELSYQDMWQQLALLMIAYARSLQYWAEKQSLPRSQNLCPLAESVIELWEAVKEYVTCNHQDIVQGLGVTHIESPRHEPHTTILAMCCHHKVRNRRSGEQLLMLLPPLPKEIWLSVLPHQPEHRGRTLVCYSSQPL